MGDSDVQEIGKALDVLNAKDGSKGGIKANVGSKDKKDKDKKATGRGAASSKNQKGKKGDALHKHLWL